MRATARLHDLSLATLVRYSKTLDLGIEPGAPHARQFAQLTSAVLGTVRSRTAYSGGRSDPSGSSDVSVSSTSEGPGLGFATRSSATGTAVLGLAESLCPACASFLPRCCSARAELHETHNTCFLPHHEKLPPSSKDSFLDFMRHRGKSIHQQVDMFLRLPSSPPDAFLPSLPHKRRSRETCVLQTHKRWTREPFTQTRLCLNGGHADGSNSNSNGNSSNATTKTTITETTTSDNREIEEDNERGGRERRREAKRRGGREEKRDENDAP